MERAQAWLESLKLLDSWSKWLVTLQSAICALLWQPLKQQVPGRWPGTLLFLGWSAFCLSVITSTVLLARLPTIVETLADDAAGIGPANPYQQVRARPLLGERITVGHVVTVQHALFVVGVALVLLFVLNRPGGRQA
jgi:hypothetical protein